PLGSIIQSRYRSGPSGRSKLANSLRTRYRKSGVPGAGGDVSAGGRRPASNRSLAAKAMPPQIPLLALPFGIPSRRNSGPFGNALGKPRPFDEGRKPGTRALPTLVHPSDPGRMGHRRR